MKTSRPNRAQRRHPEPSTDRPYLGCRPIVTKQLGPDAWSAASPLDKMECAADTEEAALVELKTVLDLKAFAAHRLRTIKNASRVAFDPTVGHYVAECPAAGIVATGFTRQDAWDRLLRGLQLRDEAEQARREAEASEEEAALADEFDAEQESLND